MLYYCLKHQRNEERKNPKDAKTNKRKLILLSKCVVRDIKILRFIKNQEANGLLSNLGLKVPLSKIPALGDILK